MPAFATTRWTLIAMAQGDSDEARAALAELCRAYWKPIHAFIRRTHEPEAARDLTQDFLVLMLERSIFHRVDRSRGRFRSFLLVALKRFLTGERERVSAQKRGGGKLNLSFDDEGFAERYSAGPESETPERIFERTWAETVMGRAMERLRNEQAPKGNVERFESLRGLLTDPTSSGTADVAARIGMTEGAVRVAVHRLRQQYREVLLAEIADTVSNQNEVEEELRELLQAVAR